MTRYRLEGWLTIPTWFLKKDRGLTGKTRSKGAGKRSSGQGSNEPRAHAVGPSSEPTGPSSKSTVEKGHATPAGDGVSRERLITSSDGGIWRDDGTGLIPIPSASGVTNTSTTRETDPSILASRTSRPTSPVGLCYRCHRGKAVKTPYLDECLLCGKMDWLFPIP